MLPITRAAFEAASWRWSLSASRKGMIISPDNPFMALFVPVTLEQLRSVFVYIIRGGKLRAGGRDVQTARRPGEKIWESLEKKKTTICVLLLITSFCSGS